jgi:hypothetical protein
MLKLTLKLAPVIPLCLLSGQARQKGTSPTKEELPDFSVKPDGGPGWKYIATRDTDFLFYKKATVRRLPAGTFRIWIKWMPTSGGPDSGYELAYEELDCSQMTSRGLARLTYGANGDPLRSSYKEDKKGTPIVPDTVDDDLARRVCLKPIRRQLNCRPNHSLGVGIQSQQSFRYRRA